MKVGDIVYFKSSHTVIYSKNGGSYKYRFNPGDRYLINKTYGNYDGITNLGITNLEDNTIHFAYIDIVNKLISVDEWRNIQLNEILN